MSPFELKESSGWFPPLPKMFHADYELGNYSQGQIEKIMWKYLIRKQNCARAWVRIHQHAPETLTSKPLDILELSTAHGAQLEIWRSLGHNVGIRFNCAQRSSPLLHIMRSTERHQTATRPHLLADDPARASQGSLAQKEIDIIETDESDQRESRKT